MPEVVVTCPHCQAKAKLKSTKMLGKKVNCRSCETPFVLKADGQKKKAARKPPADDFDDFDDEFDSAAVARARRARKKKGKSGSSSGPQKSNSKSKKSEQEKSQPPVMLLVGGSVLGLALTGGLVYFMFTAGSSLSAQNAAQNQAAVPAKYAKFHPEVGDFGCEYPEGWTVKNGGGQGGVQSWGKFLSPDESVSISVRANMTGGALGGAGLAMTQGADSDEIEPPVVDIHRLMKRKVEDDYPNYEEIGDYKLFETKMGDTCQSVFTTKALLGGKQRGYRVTLLTGRVQFNMICLCPDGQFDQMRPVFDKVIQTIYEK
ncbi:hypothetical protein Pan153_11890 [Gimesia panareensis]|uniref:Zinc finger/thioredoxin putative domain-containing protein n=1 Tax=Gimesia panareensis TaxID=2527978 RepID=A0A518FJM4_9PLAN|nr:hypothetical protein [Gimesia panareensis]QDV16558.1 hypothetical protein Pan153_11890 [Gimesia panareensis]